MIGSTLLSITDLLPLAPGELERGQPALKRESVRREVVIQPAVAAASFQHVPERLAVPNRPVIFVPDLSEFFERSRLLGSSLAGRSLGMRCAG
ncbi:MAG: hypothetical protein P1U77_05800, partial [Rubripirellula sp.]|nr:hypothetical protein [Rubripirellula sp.]